MQRMLFKEGIEINNQYGIINTVRLGDKWAKNLTMGEAIELECVDPDTTKEYCRPGAYFPINVPSYWDDIRLGQVVGLKQVTFNAITDDDLKYNFDQECRTKWGIHERLNEIYEPIAGKELVTLVDIKLL